MEIGACERCGRAVKMAQSINQTGDPAVVAYLSMVTTGIRPRLRTKYQRGIFCPQCSVSVAFGPTPEGSFNQKLHAMLREMMELDREGSIIGSAKVLLFNPDAKPALMPGSKPDETLNLPLLRTSVLGAAS